MKNTAKQKIIARIELLDKTIKDQRNYLKDQVHELDKILTTQNPFSFIGWIDLNYRIEKIQNRFESGKTLERVRIELNDLLQKD